MEDVLDLYEEEYYAKRPVVCFDEKLYQLVGHAQEPIQASPRHCRREDYEYVREGTCNIFVLVDPKGGKRRVKVTARRTKKDFAECICEMVDVHFGDAEKIRLVLDNLNTHRLSTLYEYFSPSEARRIIKKVEVHYTPKHGSWLNMAARYLHLYGKVSRGVQRVLRVQLESQMLPLQREIGLRKKSIGLFQQNKPELNWLDYIVKDLCGQALERPGKPILVESGGKEYPYTKWEGTQHGKPKLLDSKELETYWPTQPKRKPGKHHPWR